MNLLGFRFTEQGMEPFPDRCNAIQNFVVPKTRTGIQRFIGMVRYYQRFCPKLAEMSQPLTKLLKKGADVPRDWDSEQDTAVLRWNADSNKVQNRISIQQNRPIVENICDCVLLCCLHMLLYLCMLHFDNSARMALGGTAEILRMQCIIIL